MRLHYLQHVPFEDPAGILTWAAEEGHAIQGTRLDLGQPLPDPATYDWLIVMGGPMSIGDEDRFAWLADEKRHLESALRAEKTVLGICLGAQLIADVLGARVYPGPHREIGWFPVTRTTRDPSPLSRLPETFTALHWHGETFDIPSGAVRLAASEAYVNQAFVYGDRTLALQFHLESDPPAVQRLITHCGDELDGGPFTQSPDAMTGDAAAFAGARTWLHSVLEALSAVTV